MPSRRSIASKAIFPEQSTTRSTSPSVVLEVCAGSSITSCHAPVTKSSMDERATRARSSDFGVMTMSGRRTPRSTWARSRWKY